MENMENKDYHNIVISMFKNSIDILNELIDQEKVGSFEYEYCKRSILNTFEYLEKRSTRPWVCKAGILAEIKK